MSGPIVLGPTVEAPAGTITGWSSGTVDHWSGIRYAHAVRFGVPEPVAPAIIEATTPAAACPQVPYPDSIVMLPNALHGLGTDEHCQRLSIHAPADRDPGEKLPVVIYIHGGAYVTGAGDSIYYDPTVFVREQRVVWVSVTYRLGILGYLKSASGPANLGLLDQAAAVAWVHANIAAFGGDPECVTLAGQSAGADAVAHLMIAQGMRGRFRRVISQSPPLGIADGRDRLGRIMGQRFDRKELAGAPIDQLLSIQDHVGQSSAVWRSPRHFGMPYTVSYGDAPLPAEDEVGAAWAAVAPEIDVLMGTTSRETAFYVPPSVSSFTPRVAGAARTVDSFVSHTTRSVFDSGVDAFMARHWDAGGRGHRYVLDWGPDSAYFGAHVVDMPLLFPGEVWHRTRLMQGVSWPEVERIGRALRDSWGRFVRTGDPGETPSVLRMTARPADDHPNTGDHPKTNDRGWRRKAQSKRDSSRAMVSQTGSGGR